MYKKVFVGRALNNLKSSPKLPPFSKVVVVVTDEIKYEAGDNSGQTLTVKIPWGTQQIANNLLNQYRGYQYQPFKAKGANIDPAAEIGDGITTGSVYGGLFQQDITFGHFSKSNYSAPQEEQIDHEFPFTPKRDRVVNRETNLTRATLKVQAGLIAAKVESVGGDRKSFGWELKNDHHSWFSDGVEVVRFERDNFKFKGRIEAKSGLIGGFTIAENYLHTGNGTWAHCDPGEIYIGPEGINLSEKCYIRASGELYAESGTFKGSVRAGSIEYGGSDGTFSGSGLTAGTVTGGLYGKISGSTITTANTIKAINSALANADTANSVLFGSTHCTNVIANGTISGNQVTASSIFNFKGKACKWGIVNGVNVITYG